MNDAQLAGSLARRRLIPLTVLLLGSLSSNAHSQALSSPSAHWGSVTLPDIGNRVDVAFNIVGFTRFGKEQDSTDAYLFVPYNEIPGTLGFNILSVSWMDNTWLSRKDRGESTLEVNPFSRRRTAMIGYLWDATTKYFQNTVIHTATWNDLAPVPRALGDTPERISQGNPKTTKEVWGFGEEYFLRLSYTRQDRLLREYRTFTPLFVGGGWLLSSINQEAFLQAGSNIAELPLPKRFYRRKGGGIRGVGFGGSVRGGLLLPGGLGPAQFANQFNDLTSAYINAQLVFRVRLDIASFPVELEVSRTAANGFFVATRDDEERRLVEEVGSTRSEVYSAKRGMRETFGSVRARIGQFTFETFNDSPGGKDKGPTFGASVAFNAYTPRVGKNDK